MRVLLISNEKSGSAERGSPERLAKILSDVGKVTAIQPGKDEFDAVVDAAASEADLVVAAGGDGTVNRTVNAIRDQLERVQIAVVPLGTGNDFARTLGVPLDDPEEAARGIVDAGPRFVDLCLAKGPGIERLFVNACIGGFPVEVGEAGGGKGERDLRPLAD